jgi:hypothetical protein
MLAVRQLPLGDAATTCVDQGGTARGGALVEREDEVAWDAFSFGRRT